MDRDFNKNILLSLVVHVVFFVVVFIGGEYLQKVFQSDDVEIIRSSVRVDVVGMPKFTVQELKKMQAQPVIEKTPEVAKGKTEEAKPETEDVIKKDDLVIQEEGKKKSNFLNLLNDYSSKKVKAKPQEKGNDAGTSNKKLDSLIIEGNKISKGSALVGDYSDAENSEFSAYVQNLPGVIREHWKLPGYLLEKNLRCRIRIYLNREGKLIKQEIVESSGDNEFDARARAAVEAAKYPVPSKEVGDRLIKSGIILGFPI